MCRGSRVQNRLCFRVTIFPVPHEQQAKFANEVHHLTRSFEKVDSQLPSSLMMLIRQPQEGGGDSIVFQLRLLTHSGCQCDITQQRVSASPSRREQQRSIKIKCQANIAIVFVSVCALLLLLSVCVTSIMFCVRNCVILLICAESCLAGPPSFLWHQSDHHRSVTFFLSKLLLAFKIGGFIH